MIYNLSFISNNIDINLNLNYPLMIWHQKRWWGHWWRRTRDKVCGRVAKTIKMTMKMTCAKMTDSEDKEYSGRISCWIVVGVMIGLLLARWLECCWRDVDFGSWASKKNSSGKGIVPITRLAFQLRLLHKHSLIIAINRLAFQLRLMHKHSLMSAIITLVFHCDCLVIYQCQSSGTKVDLLDRLVLISPSE